MTDGCMVALRPPADVAGSLAVADGLPADELHCTLVYCGKAADVDVARLKQIVAAWAAMTGTLSGSVSGVGTFLTPDGPLTYASVDLPGLPEVRQQLVEMLDGAGLPVSREHGFTPHITLAYGERSDITVDPIGLAFDEVWVVAADERTSFDLTGRGVEAAQANTVVLDTARGTTLLTAPITALREVAGANGHYLEISGAYVGSEVPNRNGALWTTADLEFGVPSVTHGPLNWLHEWRTVVGCITGAKLVRPAETAADTGREHPYIATTSVLWTWLYPDEARLVEQAAEWGRAWHSMECISETVLCAGENGCGQSFPYMDMVRGRACAHMKERSSTRRFQNPTFLGGALILPPARPGWAFANAEVKSRASALAEAAYDQAGRSDLTATEWESLMLGVLELAETGGSS